jgi:DNA processing protein
VSGDSVAACPACLRRAWLIASLAGHIEQVVDRRRGPRAHELLGLPDERLARELAGASADELLEGAAGLDSDGLLAEIAAVEAWAVCRHGPGYPDALGDLGDPPGALFGRGDLRLLAELEPSAAVTIVGTRRPSSYGRDLASTLAGKLAATGLVVVSGMALGIDSCAHAGALEAGGLTIAVLGTGVDVPYPPRSTRLYRRIVERGVVIGELPPGTRARRWMFPARNRLMAALGGMTVVVEARERSGSLITSEMAQELGREVGAVPGRVGASSAAGTNGMLRDGAAVIRGAEDVLDSLLGPGAADRIASLAQRGPPLEAELEAVLELVDGGGTTPDALARASSLEPGPLAAALVRLELAGYLRSDSTGRYERTTLAAPAPASA